MTRARTSKLAGETLSDPAIEHYLREHPEFFERHSGLLETLAVPHVRGGAVSLVERQVAVLRERNRQLERKLTELVQVARENESLSSRLHRLAVALMEADGLQDVIATTRELLRNEFPSTQVVLKLFRNPRTALQASAHLLASDDPAAPLFDGLFRNKRPVAGLLTDARVDFLFDTEAGQVASAVMVPLVDDRRLGVLALGSVEQDRFRVGMGTLFLGYLGELVSRAIGAHLGR
ncbi:MAG: DUF484 family protein [Gammaproteobacteria bacterium]|nr:DUF484 family protein [Gammaproteobacteria bacterium]